MSNKINRCCIHDKKEQAGEEKSSIFFNGYGNIYSVKHGYGCQYTNKNNF